ncbi:major facilitator superfamily domain-containing protein 6-like isoform X1 [Aquila chrysaetos chrysaetos]|uniref:major facilitator superfamily domain-containing protein 6-like isoform X1 n=1 Tax=Aquila chrysaetos chrysaetos TaxID=223781 RepID=UPI0011772EB3|nr:major facilitator superfamily domain-containing protein 6-like isoform X1 [Aquila chrysaetos chrysaetos]
MSEQWDVGRALALSGLFRLLQGAGKACAAPFLTLYLRHLGLPAPLVGVVAGAKHLAAALWAPLCSRCPKGRRKRRLLVAGSLLGSAGASLLLTLIPPAGGDVGYKYCNASQQPGDRGAATAAAGPGTSSYGVLSASAITNAKAVSKETTKTTADVLMASRKPTLTSLAFQGLFGLTDRLEKKGRGVGESDTKTNGYLVGPSIWTTSVKAVNWETREPEMLSSYRPPLHGLEKETSSLGPAAVDLADNAEESPYAIESNELSLFKTTLPAVGDAYMSGNLSDHRKDAQDFSFKAVQNIFQDREHQIFLMVLGAVVLWELLATSLEWTVDDSLYEFLDFVDATDRYGKLWIWNYLGASVGACSIAVFVDQLNCFLSSTITRLAVHFYGYALLITLSLLVSAFIPIHVPKKTDRINKTTKALALLWSDGRAILYTITIFFTGVAGSAVHNFLFWQMQDRGSKDEIVSMADSTTTIDDIEGELFKIERIREILVRRESELRYMMDDIQLCKEISRLKKELQKLIALPENEKSNEEKQKEEELVQQIHKLVETRDFLVDDVEFERLREREEDKEMAEFLQSKLSKSYLQKATPVKEKKMTSRGQQTSTPYMTKTGLTLLKECCGFTCSIM